MDRFSQIVFSNCSPAKTTCMRHFLGRGNYRVDACMNVEISATKSVRETKLSLHSFVYPTHRGCVLHFICHAYRPCKSIICVFIIKNLNTFKKKENYAGNALQRHLPWLRVRNWHQSGFVMFDVRFVLVDTNINAVN